MILFYYCVMQKKAQPELLIRYQKKQTNKQKQMPEEPN